ncbi:hypothetical protein V6N13_045768 [Hibiscus sabdariffa]
MRADRRGKDEEEGKQGVISLFVENLPESLHWKGFWFAFARHGEVVNVYIARKKSRGDKRFGFVRMENMRDVNRAIQRLNGFILHGSRLVVKIAKDKHGWKRNTAGRSQPLETKQTGNGKDDDAVVQMMVAKGSVEETTGNGKLKRIIGHVENEDLWKLRRCLVGVMDTVCSVFSIHNRLLKWGLGEINVQRLGAKRYLLTILDEELSLMLEDVNWLYLKEIFSDVIHWSEKMSYSERATWLEIRGLPLHCWNNVSLKKIAALWGSFEALGENDNHSLDCEKATVLISTNQMKRIEEVIEWKKIKKVNEKTEESVSESKSETEKKDKAEVEVDRSWSGMEEEAQEAMWAGRDFINEGNREKEIPRGPINFSELLGEVPKVETANGRVENTADTINGEEKLTDQEGENNNCLVGSGNEEMDGNSDQELNTLAGHEANPRKISGSQSGPELSRGEVTNHVDHMGYDAVRVEESNKQLPEAKKKWADSLNEKINTGKSWSRLSNGANNPKKNWIGIFFAEFEDKKEKKRKKKAKKFGSLLEIQNNSISDECLIYA